MNTIASLQREKTESEETAANEKKLLEIKNVEVCFDKYFYCLRRKWSQMMTIMIHNVYIFLYLCVA